MAEPFKNLVSMASIRRLGDALARVTPFDVAAFEAEANEDLHRLELKARVAQVAARLRPRLPERWSEAVSTLVAALPPENPELHGHAWLWPALQVVESWGADEPAVSLPALRLMTSRFSAEFAIRPLLIRHPDGAYDTLLQWTGDASEHVRRLVSEGSRPRLPWGVQLRDAVRDPSRGLALLDRLVDDPSAYVRRSVANHLGDVAKDHPERAVAVAARWLEENPARRSLVRHALRDPLKKGVPAALVLFGHAKGVAELSNLVVSANDVVEGESVFVTADVRGCGAVRVDVVWQWPAVRGGWSSKTFRGGERTLQKGEVWNVRVRLSCKAVTTRPQRFGPQRLWLRVNGLDVGPLSFTLHAHQPG